MSSDGRWVLSGGRGETLTLWNVAKDSSCQFMEGAPPITNIEFSEDSRWVLLSFDNMGFSALELDWEYEAREPRDWDEGARPHLVNFLTLHTPYEAELPSGRAPTEEEFRRSLSRKGKARWTESDFDELMETLANGGFGWLRKEGVRRELEKMAADWNGPPPLR